MEMELPLGGSSSTGHIASTGMSYSGGTGRMHHSLSTPAGVDCGAGGSSMFRTPPATPNKQGKMLAVRVQMLDDSITMFQVQAKALGRVLFDQVCRQLHLLEADYFGLEYQELGGTKYWLDLEKPVCRQVGLSLIDPLLRFCVKFYTPDPARLEEEFTRYLFCLQVKRDLAHGCIQCNENTSALMASYIVQAECGDFVPEDYPDHTYLSSYKFFPLQDADLERRIMENHKKHMGQSPAEADLNLLETARRCELYGMKMHPAKDHEGVPLNIAVAHMGIVVFQHLTRINTFSWAKIRKISFKRKRFLVKLHPEGYGYYKDLVEFFFEGRNECKNFWKKCVENHGFFRCTTVKRVPRHRTRVLSRGSSFRYSGRTQKQIVEFVRDNYVKRQTFQRSQSFRVSRSLVSSRANVGSVSTSAISGAPPPPPGSLSPHPLLPLPPGSHAISLEWDKQPQYLEASLMMRGYTEEQARSLRRETRGERLERVDPMNCVATTRAQVNTTQTDSPENMWSPSTSPPSTSVPAAAQPPRPPTRGSRSICTSPPPGNGEIEEEDEEDSQEKTDGTTSTSEAISPEEGSYVVHPTPTKRKHQMLAASTPKENDGDQDNRHSTEVHANGDCKGAAINGMDKTPGASRGQLNSDSSYSIDVLSGGESECESLRKKTDTLGRLFKSATNGVISEHHGAHDTLESRHLAKSHADEAFYITKELLMTERTYKKDLEVITLWLREELPVEAEKQLCGGPLFEELAEMLAPQAALLKGLEAGLGARPLPTHHTTLTLTYLKQALPMYSRWIGVHQDSLQRLEEACRASPALERTCRSLEHTQRACYLPLLNFCLKPLYRILHYSMLLSRASELYSTNEEERETIEECLTLLEPLCQQAEEALPASLNYCHLCLLQRDIDGFDNLVSPGRHFIRQGCLFKHSNKGSQQRMFFLFSDILLYGSKSSSSQQQFRTHGVLPVHTLQVEQADYSNSFTLYGGGRAMTLSASSPAEKAAWMEELEAAAEEARDNKDNFNLATHNMHTLGSAEELSDSEPASGTQRSNTLAHVCWHRSTSLSFSQLLSSSQHHLSGYLLRKFKNSLGWQKLWVVFTSFCLYFYKTCHDDFSLASLPLLGYVITTPNERDGINKDFVFKLIFKNHVYFFRAESDYTFKRWMEVIGSATVQTLEKINQ